MMRFVVANDPVCANRGSQMSLEILREWFIFQIGTPAAIALGAVHILRHSIFRDF